LPGDQWRKDQRRVELVERILTGKKNSTNSSGGEFFSERRQTNLSVVAGAEFPGKSFAGSCNSGEKKKKEFLVQKKNTRTFSLKEGRCYQQRKGGSVQTPTKSPQGGRGGLIVPEKRKRHAFALSLV